MKLIRHQSSSIILLFLGVSILSFGLWLDQILPRKSITQINKFHSAAFHNSQIKDPYLPPQPHEIYTFNQSEWVFTTIVPNKINTGEIAFWFKCNHTCPFIELSLLQQNQSWLTLPIFIPGFSQLKSFAIESNGIFLYQKPFKFTSINQLITNNVDNSLIYIDPQLISSIPSSFQTIPLSQQIPSSPPYYILSRYQPPNKTSDWYTVIKRIDLSQAAINNSQITWKLNQNGKPQSILIGRLEGGIIN